VEEMIDPYDEISRVGRSREQARVAYDRMSRWYDLFAGGFEAKHRAKGLRTLNPRPGEAMLEIGVGTGRSLVELAGAVGATGRVCGIDLSPGMLAIARKRITKAGLVGSAALARADAVRLPYQASSFDGIFMSFTLELFDTPEIQAVLAECRRVLRTGGRLCVTAMAKKPKAGLTTRLYERLHEMLPNILDCRPIYVQETVREAGFHVAETTAFSMFGLDGEVVLGERK
jgi:ubiquinone/menaquinone biosynthesis C-methylase UbiE